MTRNILLSLDELFDTRLTTLAMLSPQLAAELYTNGEYLDRQKDEFKHISNDVFRAAYKKRDMRSLVKPYPTSVIDLILMTLIKIQETIYNSNTEEQITIFINVYPFTLSKKEVERIIVGFAYRVPSDIRVEAINIEHIKPAFIRDNEIGMFFNYDGAYWLNRLVTDGNIGSLKELTLFIPDLIGDTANEKEKEDLIHNIMIHGLSIVGQLEFVSVASLSASDANIRQD